MFKTPPKRDETDNEVHQRQAKLDAREKISALYTESGDEQGTSLLDTSFFERPLEIQQPLEPTKMSSDNTSLTPTTDVSQNHDQINPPPQTSRSPQRVAQSPSGPPPNLPSRPPQGPPPPRPSNSPRGSNDPNHPSNLPLPSFQKASQITRLIKHEFSGNPAELQPFLDDCSLAQTYCPPEFKRNLFIEIISRITNAARSDLAGKKEIKTYEALIDYLQKKYKYQYTFSQLCEQLSNVSQKPNEKINDYADRIRHIVWKLKEAARTENENAEYAEKLSEQLALNRFKNHTYADMARFLRTKGVRTFDEAVQEALEEERQSSYQSPLKTKYCSNCKRSNHNTSECRAKYSSPTASTNSSKDRLCKRDVTYV